MLNDAVSYPMRISPLSDVTSTNFLTEYRWIISDSFSISCSWRTSDVKWLTCWWMVGVHLWSQKSMFEDFCERGGVLETVCMPSSSLWRICPEFCEDPS